MKFEREILGQLYENIGQKPIVILYGARQVGKTTLMRELMARYPKCLYLQGDDPKDAQSLEHRSATELAGLVGGYDLVVIDEAQRIEDIGITLKLIADNVPGARVVATGSSSFELANRLNEPLTGRNRKFYLYPLSLGELIASSSAHDTEKRLDDCLAFGMYPEIVAAPTREQKMALIRELATDYLFKDLFIFGDIRNAFAFERLVKLLALRVGSEISYAELAKEAGISRPTVLTYVRLLEQAFIIFRLTPLHTNKDKEVVKQHKIYFYDVGIRNALLGNTDPIELRADKGAIFENFFIAEKMKEIAYRRPHSKSYFWKTKNGSEVDFVETDGTSVHGYECKWKQVVSTPIPWKSDYPDASFACVTKDSIVREFSL